MYKEKVRRAAVPAIIHAQVPLRVKFETLLFVLLFPDVFTALVALRDTLMAHNAAIQAQNNAVKVLIERTDILWRYVVGERKTGYIT